VKLSDKDEIVKICSQPDRCNYVSLLDRPGLFGWAVELEYTQFTPDTDAWDGFHLMLCKWPENIPIPLTIAVVSIDKSGQPFADSILWDHGLRKCSPGMTIRIMSAEGIEDFWLHGPDTFVLENHSKGSEHVVYTNDPIKLQAAREHENAMAQRFVDEHLKWLETPEGKAIADAYWKKNPSGKAY
jgi:hypothetical protein